MKPLNIRRIIDRRSISIVLIFLVAFTGILNSSLNSSQSTFEILPGEYESKPSEISLRSLTSVTILVDDQNNVKATVEDDYNFIGNDSYHIQIDLRTMKYTLSYIEVVNQAEDQNKVQSGLGLNVATQTKYVQLKLVTDDPVGIDVALTTHRLVWDYDLAYPWRAHKNYWTGDCTTASTITTWYIDACEQTSYYTYGYSNTVKSVFKAEYHNYDFGFNWKRTDADHGITLYGKPNGAYSTSYTFSHTGEFSWLLDLDVFTSVGFPSGE